jgi:hypothetical protein
MAFKTIEQSFWTDPKVEPLKPEQKLLLLYLITNPLAHHSGLYHIRLVIIEAETGLSRDAIKKALGCLEDAGLIKNDHSLNLVWVKNMAKHQIKLGNRENIIKGIGKHFKGLHKSLLIKDFLEYYSDLKIDYTIPSRWHADGIDIPSGISIGTDTDMCTDSFKEKIESIFDHWNSLGIIKHKKLTEVFKSKINARLHDGHTIDEIKEAMSNYKTVLEGDEYFFTYQWGIDAFMNPKNLERFMTDNKPFDNFRNKGGDNGHKGRTKETGEKARGGQESPNKYAHLGKKIYLGDEPPESTEDS